MKFEDLTVHQLRKIISYFRFHLLEDIKKKRTRDELLGVCNTLFEIKNDNKIHLKVNKPFQIDIPENKVRVRKPKKVAEPKPKKIAEPEQVIEKKPVETKHKLIKFDEKPEPNKQVLKELEQKRERVYNIMFKILSSPSTRSRNQLNKEMGLEKDDYELISKIFQGNRGFDFIPTPPEYLKPMLETIKEREDETFLEPCCGLGVVIHHVLKVSPKIKITAYEINNDFMEMLKKLFPAEYYPNITFHRKNFLQADEKGSYSTIFCNPPFTHGSDSRFYINFFFECNRISKNSMTNFHDNLVYFISPKLYETWNEKSDYIDPTMIATSSYMNKKRIEDILKRDVTTKQFNEFKKNEFDSDIFGYLEDYEASQISLIDTIKFKAGASITAYSYLCLNV
jgi:predicted RNA methylase